MVVQATESAEKRHHDRKRRKRAAQTPVRGGHFPRAGAARAGALIALLALAFFAFAFTPNARAETLRDPHRYDESHRENIRTPATPPGYSEKKTEHFRFVYPQGAEARIAAFADKAEAIRARYVWEIGIDPEGVTDVYLARNVEDFQGLQPGGNRMPDWVAAVAYTRHNLILMRQAGSQGQPIDLLETFRHELSHIILRQAVGNRDLPKWFVEGLAQWQARQFELERSLRLAKALISGRLIPLGELVYRFPQSTMDVHLAYDESFAFVNFLVAEYGQNLFQELIRRLGEGESFVPALESTYSTTLLELEDRWVADLKMDYNWIPLLTSGGAIWTLAAIIFVVGYVFLRRRRKQRMDEWERAEREAEEQNRERERRIAISDRDDDDSDSKTPPGSGGSNLIH